MSDSEEHNDDERKDKSKKPKTSDDDSKEKANEEGDENEKKEEDDYDQEDEDDEEEEKDDEDHHRNKKNKSGLIGGIVGVKDILEGNGRNDEMSVRTSDLQICKETTTGVDSTGQYQLTDLVYISPDNVGVVVRIEKECLHILNIDGKVEVVPVQSVKKEKINRNPTTFDSQNNNLHLGDIVNVIDGPFANRQGQIKHLYQHFVFIFCRTLTENGGLFVCKAPNLLLARETSEISSVPSSTPFNVLYMSTLDETSQNIDQTEASSSITSINLNRKFQIEFDKAHIHPLFNEEERKAMKERFDCAKRLLANIVSSDHRCIRIWSNIVDGIYAKMDGNLSIVQTVEILLTPPNTSPSVLEKLIQEKIIIGFVHPDAVASESVLNPVRTKEYATTTPFTNKAFIAINPMVFDVNCTRHGSNISGESSCLFLAILLLHEMTHAMKYIGEKITSTPELPFFETYAHPPEYDAGHALEHELIHGELHINRDRNHPDIELFIIDLKNKHHRLSQFQINDCLMKNNVESLLSISRSNRGREQANSNQKKTRCFAESSVYLNNQNDERFIPLLAYHKRYFEENDLSNEHYQSLLKYHSDQDSSEQQSPDDPLLQYY